MCCNTIDLYKQRIEVLGRFCLKSYMSNFNANMTPSDGSLDAGDVEGYDAQTLQKDVAVLGRPPFHSENARQSEAGPAKDTVNTSSMSHRTTDRLLRAATTRRPVVVIKSAVRNWGMLALVMLADVIAIALAVFVSVKVRHVFGGDFHPSLYWNLWSFLGLFVLAYAALGLYPGILISGPEELKRTCWGTSLVFLGLGAFTFFSREAHLYSRSIFIASWAVAIILVPLLRSILRTVCHRAGIWGFPAIIFGAGKTGEELVRILLTQKRIGLAPAAFLDDDPAKHGLRKYGIPVIGKTSLGPELARRFGKAYAILAMPGVDRDRLMHIQLTYAKPFYHQLIIPNLFGTSSLWATAEDLGGMLGLQVRQKLLHPGRQCLKRGLDLTLATLFSIMFMPLIAVLAMAIKLESRGPVFFRQQRLGRDGKPIFIWKFRSMVRDADNNLKEVLQQDPELCHEWNCTQKLKKDPRITRIGQLMRRMSLDEIPQLFNVLKGELALVGPRPIIKEEVTRYGKAYCLYKQVKPGLTGLWQISGRNTLSYEDRVRLDTYYVRNWSIWLDFYIILRTPIVILTGYGAY